MIPLPQKRDHSPIKVENPLVFLIVMRFANFAVLLFAGIVISKNVVYLEDLGAAIEKGQNSKREPKNVVSLEALKAAAHKEGVKGKREPKNVVDIKTYFETHNKRDQKVLLKSNDILLESLLPQMPSISIFAGYVRDNAEILNQMESRRSFTLLVAPSDDAIATKLGGMKPWEFPEIIKNDEHDDETIASNIDSFLRAHISVEQVMLAQSNEISTILLNGKEVVIHNDPTTGIYTLRVEGKNVPVKTSRLAGNGVVLIIDEVLSKPDA